MKADIKAKWLEALRSGKYEQGKGLLRSMDNKFCCIGVLCDVVDPSKWATYSHYPNEERQSYNNEHTTCLPHSVELATRIDHHYAAPLYSLNDKGESFLAIADYIERNIPADKEVEGLS